MHAATRRAVLAGLAASCASRASATTNAAPDSLAAAAERAGLVFGAAIAPLFRDDPGYAALYARETRIVTTDNALKFGALRPTRDAFDFGDADDILAFAQTHDIAVRGHTLAWNENLPDWLKRLSAREATRVFDEHIDRVAGRYAGRLHSWDVVNEPFWPGHNKPGGFRDGAWLQAMGPGYIKRAFLRARAADPAARLCLNEAHCENDNDWGRGIRPRLMQLVDQLLDAGAPLHAIGLQAHLQPQSPYDDDAFLAWLTDLASRKVDIYITELDVNDSAFPDDVAARDAAVARRYADFLGRVLRVPQVKLVITWELADCDSWYRDVPSMRRGGRTPRPLPFDTARLAKPARDALVRAFQERRA